MDIDPKHMGSSKKNILFKLVTYIFNTYNETFTLS